MREKVLCGCAVVLAGSIAVSGLVNPVAAAGAAGFVKADKSDRWIAWRVDAMLHNDNRFDYRDVEVTANGGTVILGGWVMTEYERGHAAKVAGNVPGVKAVKNTISVIDPVNDNFVLAKKVRTQILKNPVLTVTALDVSAVQGTVELHGIVADHEQKTQIGDIVKAMPDVTAVVNELLVGSDG